jgi:hypothetical protein
MERRSGLEAVRKSCSGRSDGNNLFCSRILHVPIAPVPIQVPAESSCAGVLVNLSRVRHHTVRLRCERNSVTVTIDVHECGEDACQMRSHAFFGCDRKYVHDGNVDRIEDHILGKS